MTYKGESITVSCCGEPMKNLGVWPHNTTTILVSRFLCLKCRNDIKVIEPGSIVIDGKEEAA
jgi:hypothetical protein